jgi:YfiH family protein
MTPPNVASPTVRTSASDPPEPLRKSKLLASVTGIDHVFATLPERIPEEFGWTTLRPRWRQVHGTQGSEVFHAQQDCGEVDSLWTATPGLPVAATSADCVPILLARKDGTRVAAVHAGWRGTQARILSALWLKLRASGEKPRDWVAAIGPAIGPCCYEVSETLALEFRREFGWLAVPSHRRLDLPLINALELHEIGLEELELLRACTRCARTSDDEAAGDGFAFRSFRREGKGAPQHSIIRIRPPGE